MGLVNDLINKSIVAQAETPRDSWSFGTVMAAPTAGKVAVTIDGDTTATSMVYASAPAVGDRVVVMLLGTTRMVIAVVGGCPYAVGDWLTTESAVLPSVRWPGTTWVAITDRMPMGASSTYPVGSVGGEAEHKLTGDEMPSHTHSLRWNQPDGNGGGAAAGIPYNYTNTNVIGYDSNPVLSSGGGAAHNNLPPYQAAYIWKRTA